MDSETVVKPPYTSYSRFIKHFRKMKEDGVPAKVDASIFGNASGSFVYGMLRAYEFLRLIDSNGTPTVVFNELVDSSEDDAKRRQLISNTIREAYTPLFGEEIDLASATQGQFDKIIRDEYDVSGSTVDKVAAFFLAAAKDAEIPISVYLQKRKLSGPKKSNQKSKPSKKPDNSSQETSKGQNSTPQKISEKALEYKLVDLMTEAAGDPEVMAAIIKIVTWLKTKDADE